MRIQHLDLIKYGKFTNRRVEFPAANQDFHLIVGPNEAGKSTLRSAIVDLLFGIPTRSQHSFLHPLNELRLGACIGDASGVLEFQRIKAQKQTLRSPLDAVLADMALTPFLGTADRHFFDQMFGLDHNRLVSGGNSILKAEDDIGQILFQSAAGVASLGRIRDELDKEADKLWAPRKSADRAYYIAAEQLDRAASGLKDATVRTKAWVEANQKQEGLLQALDTERQRHQHLQTQRNRLERIRRLAPFLNAARDTEQKLAELGETADLPHEAAAVLSAAERELAVAGQRLELRRQEVETTGQALEQIQVDDTLLTMSADIGKLADLRLQYSAYEKDIGNRQKEIELLWQSVGELCRQLDWPLDSLKAIGQRMPAQPLQQQLKDLIRQYGGIFQALRAARQAQAQKQAEIESLTGQLAELHGGEIQPALRAALSQAKALGDTEVGLQKLQSQQTKAETALREAWQGLGQWRAPLADLLAMQPPSQEKISRLQQERHALLAEHKTESSRLQGQRSEVERVELLIAQFQNLHHPITLEAVLLARQERDAVWLAVKTEESGAARHAGKFEALTDAADRLADKRTDDREAATELQSLQNQLEREKLNLSAIAGRLDNLAKAVQNFNDAWAREMAGLQLPEMPLDELGAWLIKREKALAAATARQEAEHESNAFQARIAEAASTLLAALLEAGQQAPESDSVLALAMRAENFIQKIDSANVRRETLTAQLLAAKTQLAALQQTAAEAETDQANWSEAWLHALNQAGFAADSEISRIEGSLKIIEQIAAKLEKIRQIQIERIDAMNADLEEFAAAAKRLAELLDPALIAEPARQISLTLANRLAQTRELHAERERLKESLRVAINQAHEAQEAINTATASLRPLMRQAGVETRELLQEAITRSDEQRRLVNVANSAAANLVNDGDGLSRGQIAGEIDAADLPGLAGELVNLQNQLTDSVRQQTALAAELADATRVLAEIQGSGAAAIAEAERQEALAKMADAAERYIKVYTASRLLRWSIDRYREEKQGPLLQRAGVIFSTLTSGAFRKLMVDFDREPMVLEGVRDDGKPVGVSGLSDGTRDQLYLALRLAALEMHLEQALPLPFIADDLFINYDDQRSKAGFEALRALSEQTQVIFLSHHDHLVETVLAVFGERVNVVWL